MVLVSVKEWPFNYLIVAPFFSAEVFNEYKKHTTSSVTTRYFELSESQKCENIGKARSNDLWDLELCECDIWKFGSSNLWEIGSLKFWKCETSTLSSFETLEFRNFETLKLWNFEILDVWNFENFEIEESLIN